MAVSELPEIGYAVRGFSLSRSYWVYSGKRCDGCSETVGSKRGRKKKGSRADGRSCGPGESNLDISTFEGDQLLLIISPAVEQRPGREELVSREREIKQHCVGIWVGWAAGAVLL